VVQIPLKSIFAGMCIKMLGEKHQRQGVKTVSNHVYFIANEVREFIFVTML
jgi:hypothetical protein